jgi:hypothetical protein
MRTMYLASRAVVAKLSVSDALINFARLPRTNTGFRPFVFLSALKGEEAVKVDAHGGCFLRGFGGGVAFARYNVLLLLLKEEKKLLSQRQT